jgi:O-antigen ligase
MFLFLCVVFFFAQPWDLFWTISGPITDAEIHMRSVEEGSVVRRISLLLLGGFAVLSLLKKRQKRLRVNGFLGGLMLFFIVWACLSIAWTTDLALTVRKLVVLVMLSLGALALAKRLSLRDILAFTFVACGLVLVLGLCCEIALGTFHPLQTQYRFGGIMHPNSQGLNCAMFLIASIALAGTAGRRRSFYYVVAFAALCFVVLTKSRGAEAGVILGLVAYGSLRLSTSRKCAYLIVTLCLVCVLYLALGDNLFVNAERAVLLGREDSAPVSTLNSRTPLWQECLRYVAKRPVLGYGYDSFWTTRHLSEVPPILGWVMASAHNAYLEMLLGLGFIGGGAYILILALAINRSRALYKSSASVSHGFAYAMLVCICCTFLLASFNLGPSLPNFILFVLLAKLGFARVPLTDLKPRSKTGAVH